MKPEESDMVVRGVACLLSLMSAAAECGEADHPHLGAALWLLSECLMRAEGERDGS